MKPKLIIGIVASLLIITATYYIGYYRGMHRATFGQSWFMMYNALNDMQNQDEGNIDKVKWNQRSRLNIGYSWFENYDDDFILFVRSNPHIDTPGNLDEQLVKAKRILDSDAEQGSGDNATN